LSQTLGWFDFIRVSAGWMANEAADRPRCDTRHELPSYKDSSSSSCRPQDTKCPHRRCL